MTPHFNVLTELRELENMFSERADINDSGGPNEAMRAQMVLAEVVARVEALIEAAKALDASILEPQGPRRPLYTFNPDTVIRLRAALARLTTQGTPPT